jgi:hypothetical protein
MLRCWEIRSQDLDRPATWRFSLEDPQTKEKRAFPDLKSLVIFMETQLRVEGGAELQNKEERCDD